MTIRHSHPAVFRATLDQLTIQPLPDGRCWAYHTYATNSAPHVLARVIAERERAAGIPPIRISTNTDPWAPRYGSPAVPSKHSDTL